MNNIKRMQPLLGTFVEIGVKGNEQGAEKVITAAFEMIRMLHGLLSFHAPDSDLTRLNQANGTEVEVHPHTLRVLRLARGMTFTSRGLFNCTIGGAMVRNGLLPDHAGTDVLAVGKAEDICLSEKYARLGNRIYITLDGIAKGYVVDCAAAFLKRNGISAGWINAGGDLRVYGDMELPVDIREVGGRLVTMGRLRQTALATSYVSQNYDTRFPGKILSNLSSPAEGTWSVLSRWAWRADALTKVASLAKASERQDLVNRLGGVLALPLPELEVFA